MLDKKKLLHNAENRLCIGLQWSKYINKNISNSRFDVIWSLLVVTNDIFENYIFSILK